uniref:Transcription factor-like 5 protein n=1 Tax=Esox lucius TaxID=8010 RepID=A0AAY5L909_ESOLU
MSLACKTIHMSPAAGLYNPATVEMIVSQNDLVPNDQGQILGTEFNLMEMTEVEYTHLQHIIQSHIETQAGGTEDSGDARFNNTIFTVCSPAPQQAATTCEQQLTLGDSNQGQVDFQEFKMVLVSEGNVMSGERTPTTCGEVPSSVLAKVRKAVDMTREHGLETYDTSSAQLQARPNPPARVRLEKRFNCTPFDIPRQQDAQSAALRNSIKHQALVIPKNFTFSYRQEKMTDKVPCCLNPAEETVWVKVEGMRRIRFCCDELNVLAPFCNQETDKATTLQWTTAFLKYIREVYGDSIKQDFQSTFCGKTGQRIKPSSASSHVMVLPDTAESLSTPQASEQ